MSFRTDLASAITRFAARLAPPPAARAVPDEDDPAWGVVLGAQPTTYLRSGKNVRLLGFEGHATAQACIRIISESTAAVPLETYRMDAEGNPTVEPLTAPARQLLDRPRVGLTRHEMVRLLAAHYKGYGNAYLALERPSPRVAPTGLRVVHPEWINTVLLDRETEEIFWYTWHDRQGKEHKTHAWDMVHFKDLTLGDYLFGFPSAAAVLLEMASEREASEYVRQILTNDGAPGHVAIAEPGVTGTEARVAERRWHERMAERGGRGSTAFVVGVKDFKPVGFNLKDLEFPALRSLSRESICTAFMVDPRLVGASSAKGNEGGLSQAGYAEARRRLYSQTVIPLMESFEATLDAYLGVEWGHTFIRFSPKKLAALMETKAEKVDRLTKEMSAGGISREEYREETGRNAEMDPNDTLVGSAGRMEYPVALATALSLPPEPAPTEPGKPAEPKPGEEGDGEEAPNKEPAKKSAPAIILPRSGSRILKRGVKLSAAARSGVWGMFDTRASKEDVAYRRSALLRFAEEKRDITGMFDQAAAAGGRSLGKRDAEDPYVAAAMKRIRENYAPGGDYHEAWLREYEKLIGSTVRNGAGELASEVGFSFELDNPLVLDAISRRAAFLAEKVTGTSWKDVEAVVAAARSQGMGTRETAKLLEATFDSMAPHRAVTIARTETVGALNEGEYTAALGGGVLSTKEWLSMGDDRVRDSHAAVDGEQVKLSEAFSNGLDFPGDQAAGDPGEVINCRCTMLYYD